MRKLKLPHIKNVIISKPSKGGSAKKGTKGVASSPLKKCKS